MSAYVALLRAVNVGGTAKLPMSELKAMCIAQNFENVQTYIASGNVVFSCEQTELEVKAALEKRLMTYAGKPVGVMVRTAREMADIVEANPFPDAPRNRTVAIFLNASPSDNTLETVSGRKDEEIILGRREIYVAYGADMGRSKLRIPAAASGTARNINTIARLADILASI